MTCYQCNANWMYPNGQQLANAGISQLLNTGIAGGWVGLGHYQAAMAPAGKPKRPDLTPRQIEWCKAHISAFMPKVAK